MNNLLDILGSTVIGIYFIYMILSFNIKMSDNLNNAVVNNIAEWNTIELGKLLDYDLNKIGFRADSNDLFSVAKEDEFYFLSDIDNDGSVDSVHYILGTTTEALRTTNPNDKPLYRIVNETDTTTSFVTDFELSYIDSSGSEITPISSLSSAAKRKKIKGILIDFIIAAPMQIMDQYNVAESQDGKYREIEGEYQEIEWHKKFTPKNIY